MRKFVKPLVDLQVNGHMGTDFSGADLTPEKFIGACRRLFAEGTDVFLPTIITSPVEIYGKNLKLMAKTIPENGLWDKIPGFHLEGPFISPEPGFVGAHNPALTRKPDASLLERMFESADGKIRLLTVAAELEGIEAVVEKAVSLGITVSVGHSDFTPELLKRMSALGAKALTHLGNALPRTLAKFANPIWAGLCDDDFTAMFIADGIHIPGEALKRLILAKGTDKVIIVSDASPLAGCPPGAYDVFGRAVVLDDDGRILDRERGNLAGSSYTMRKCADFIASMDFLSDADMRKICSENPIGLAGGAGAMSL